MTEPIGYLVLDCDGDERHYEKLETNKSEILFPSVEVAAASVKERDERYAPYTIHPVMPPVATYPKPPEVMWAIVDKHGFVARQRGMSGVELTEETARELAEYMTGASASYRAVKLTIEEV